MTISDVQQLYISYFDRPADFLGLQYWQRVLDNGAVSLTDIGEFFSGSTEFKTEHASQSTASLINSIYINLFGHNADAGGLLFWSGAVNQGAVTANQVVGAIRAGALGSDALALAAKTTFATAFTNYVGAPIMTIIAGPDFNAEGRIRLNLVHDQVSLDEQLALLGTPLPVVIAKPIPAGGAPAPEHLAADGAEPVILVGVADASHAVVHG